MALAARLPCLAGEKSDDTNDPSRAVVFLSNRGSPSSSPGGAAHNEEGITSYANGIIIKQIKQTLANDESVSFLFPS